MLTKPKKTFCRADLAHAPFRAENLKGNSWGSRYSKPLFYTLFFFVLNLARFHHSITNGSIRSQSLFQ